MRVLLHILLNGIGLLVAAHLVPGFVYTGGPLELIVAGAVLGLLNLLVKPVVTFFSLPFIFVTLGLFFLVINGFIVFLVAQLLPSLSLEGCFPAILAGLVLTVFNWLIAVLIRDKK